MAQPVTMDDYNIVCTTQSKKSSESMPCGGGDIGLNVWVEDGEILFYVSRSGTFDENNAMLKLAHSPPSRRYGMFVSNCTRR